MNTISPHGVLDSQAIAADLPDGWQLECVPRTGSTNADLLARWAADDSAAGGPIKAQLRALSAPLDWAQSVVRFPPRVRVADEQSAGRGRQGRPWRTVAGDGLLFSCAVVLPCPVDALSGLSLAVGLGIVEGLRALPGMTPERQMRLGLKWPNDILLDDAKLGGVLIEMGGTSAHGSAAVIGIGLNLRGVPLPQASAVTERGATADAIATVGATVGAATSTQASAQTPTETSTASPGRQAAPASLPPACLAMLLPDACLADTDPHDGHAPAAAAHAIDTLRGTVLRLIVRALAMRLARFAAAGFAPMRDDWWQMHRFAGRPVRILDGGIEKLRGTAAGVDARGQLLIAPLRDRAWPTPSGATGECVDDAGDVADVADVADADAWIAVQVGDVSLRLAGDARVRHRLLVDSGNSRLKWALVDASGAWLAHGVLDRSDASDTASTSASPSASPPPNAAEGGGGTAARTSAWHARWRTLTPPDDIWISNVAGAVVAERIAQTCADLWPAVPRHVIRAQPAQCGLENGYDAPEALGSDRWAGMIAAHQAYPGEALLIATFGTATTIDTVTADGRFIGGWIAPGWEVMLRSLGQHTAQLPTLRASDAHAGAATGFSRATRNAIVEGCRQAQAGLILSAWRTWCTTTQDAAVPRRCIVAGGAAREVLPVLPMPVTRHEDLVLHGLSRIARSASGH